MSGIGGVGAVGMGIGAGAIGGAAFSGAAGVSGAGSVAPGGDVQAAGATSAQQALPPGLENLVQSLKDFTSAEILIALMLAKAAGGGDDEKKSSDAAAGFLAGLAMAGMLGQDMQAQCPCDPSISAPAAAGGGTAGLTLNVSV
jgi:hypothetical protein